MFLERLTMRKIGEALPEIHHTRPDSLLEYGNYGAP
jgi:hypothetical protein